MLVERRTGNVARAHLDLARRRLRDDREIQLVIGLTVLALVLRFFLIASQSFWLDESQAVHELRLSFGGMLSAWSASEWNPPLYLIIAWPWARLFGAGEADIRALSALLGTAVVPLLYLCGRELVSRRAGLVAAALAAANPFLIWYSQEAREYMLLVTLCTASFLFFSRSWRKPSAGNLAWWAVFSALALLTQYFAAFLIAAEGLALVYRARSRASLLALGSQALVLAPFVPHVAPQLQHPAQFIVSQPLSLRLQQVPVAFGMNTLYKSSLASYGLLAAAALAAIVIALLVIGADRVQLNGAGIAAALAGAVLLVPLLLALFGHDDYIARGLMPAWPPLAVVIGAACTAAGVRAGGAALALVLLGVFVYAGIRIDSETQYQRPAWRKVSAALGKGRGTRVIVAYDGQFAAGPLSIYLPRVPWAGPGSRPTAPGPVSASELDIVGDAGQRLAGKLPPGVTLISARRVDTYLVDRFALSRPWKLPPSQFGTRAAALLAPAPAQPSVLIQRQPA